MTSLSNASVAVVTGAASGIGRAVASRLAERGIHVVAVDVTEDALDHTCRAIGGLAMARVVDVSDTGAMLDLADEVFARFGIVDLVCSNAGITSRGPVWEMSTAQWDLILGVNLRGAINAVQAFVPRMRLQASGHMLFTGSIAGFMTFREGAPYCTTKHGMVALAEGLWHDLRAVGSPLGVSVLCPGFVSTGLLANSHRAGTVTASPDSVVTPGSDDALEPDEVAVAGLDGVESGTFYIFPNRDDRWIRPIALRHEAIMAMHLPSTVGPAAIPTTNVATHDS